MLPFIYWCITNFYGKITNTTRNNYNANERIRLECKLHIINMQERKWQRVEEWINRKKCWHYMHWIEYLTRITKANTRTLAQNSQKHELILFQRKRTKRCEHRITTKPTEWKSCTEDDAGRKKKRRKRKYMCVNKRTCSAFLNSLKWM